MKKIPALFALFLLAACGGNALQEKTSSYCPQAGILIGADAVPVLDPATGKLKVTGTIANFAGACRLAKDGHLQFQLHITHQVHKTEAAGSLKAMRLPYFIAILSKRDEILQKKDFWVKVSFDNDNTSETVEHIIDIPVSEDMPAASQKVTFGYLLTRDQAAYWEKNVKQK